MIRIHKLELFNLWSDLKLDKDKKSDSEIHDHIVQYVLKKFDKPELLHQNTNISIKVNSLLKYFNKKWKVYHRSKKSILDSSACKNYLSDHEEFKINSGALDLRPTCSESSGKKRGRPKENFENVSKSQKYERIKSPMKYSVEQLAMANKKKLRSVGKPNVARVLDFALKSPSKAEKLVNFCSDESKFMKGKQYTPDSALALIVSAKLTKSAYQDIKEGADALGHNSCDIKGVLLEIFLN